MAPPRIEKIESGSEITPVAEGGEELSMSVSTHGPQAAKATCFGAQAIEKACSLPNLRGPAQFLSRESDDQ